MSALNPDRASRQRDIAVGAAVFEGPAVTLASNAGAPAAAPLASNQPQAAPCAPAALTALTVSRTARTAAHGPRTRSIACAPNSRALSAQVQRAEAPAEEDEPAAALPQVAPVFKLLPVRETGLNMEEHLKRGVCAALRKVIYISKSLLIILVLN